MNTTRQLFEYLRSELGSVYDPKEASAVAYFLLNNKYGIPKEDVVSGKPVKFPDGLELDLEKLRKNVPVQQVAGATLFNGLRYRVSEDVLIPRPETEELVALIGSEALKGPLRILDIGTGSGCIAVSLAKSMHGSSVFATEVSEKALEVAKQNAIGNNVHIEFRKHDILREDLPWNDLDIIVSNPPYITNSERSLMEANVVDHEPHLALFVPDDDPLIFYRKIIAGSRLALKPRGKLYFEINERFGPEVRKLMSESFTEVEIFKDLHGKDRMARGVR